MWVTGAQLLARLFPRQHRIAGFPPTGSPSDLTLQTELVSGGFAYHSCHILSRGTTSPRSGYLPASPHRLTTTGSGPTLRHTPQHPKVRIRHGFGWLASPGSSWASCCRYGNINPLSFDYACRPRLRSRLTQGR